MAGQTTVAERYARAILSLGIESGTLAALTDEVRRFAVICRVSTIVERYLEPSRL